MKSSPHRIESLDGLRGLAILFVVGFHAFARWPDLVPYGARYAGLPVFAYGWLGVNLFFLISGYVILLTLRKCDGLVEFVKRRWLRLFPAMLICSLLIFATASWLPDRPAGEPVVLSLLPGVTFIAPPFWEMALHTQIPALEKSFWSLYLEVIFYFTFGTAYYVVGERRALIGLVAVSVLAAAATWIHLPVVGGVMLRLQLENFAWFAAGCFAFRFDQDRSRANLVMLALASLLCFTGFGQKPHDIALYNFALVLLLIFIASREVQVIGTIARSRLLVFIGFISYPFYLLHENMMIGGLVRVSRIVPQVPAELLLVGVISAIAALAYVVARFGEPVLRNALRSVLTRRDTPVQQTVIS